MRDIIALCQSWIDKKSIRSKKIIIDDDIFNIRLRNDKGVSIDFSIYIGDFKNEEENEFLTLINNLTHFNVKDNLPF